MFNEKRLLIEQRKRKLQSEYDEVLQRQQETQNEYEQEKKEIIADMDRKDLESTSKNRSVRDRTIDAEVECKRILSDIVRVKESSVREVQTSKDKMEEYDIELRQIAVSKDSYRAEMA